MLRVHGAGAYARAGTVLPPLHVQSVCPEGERVPALQTPGGECPPHLHVTSCHRVYEPDYWPIDTCSIQCHSTPASHKVSYTKKITENAIKAKATVRQRFGCLIKTHDNSRRNGTTASTAIHRPNASGI